MDGNKVTPCIGTICGGLVYRQLRNRTRNRLILFGSSVNDMNDFRLPKWLSGAIVMNELNVLPPA